MAICAEAIKQCAITEELAEGNDELFVLPVIIKTDVVGSLDAIKHELQKHNDERTHIHVVHQGVGDVTENDIKMARGNKSTIVIGFHVGVDVAARELSERVGCTIVTYDIIYQLTEWIPSAIEARRPKIKRERLLGKGTLLKIFSSQGSKYTIGVHIEDGLLKQGDIVEIHHREEYVAKGTIESIKAGPTDTTEARAGNDYGMSISVTYKDGTELRHGDILTRTITEEV